MKRKYRILRVLLWAIFLLLLTALIWLLVNRLKKVPEYQQTRIGIAVCLDEEQERTYVGTLDQYKVYVDGLDLMDSYVSTSKEKVSLKDAIKEKKITMKDLETISNEIIHEEASTILLFDNFEVFYAYNTCIFERRFS